MTRTDTQSHTTMTTQSKIEYIKAVIDSEKQIVASAPLVSERQSAQMRIDVLVKRLEMLQNDTQ